MPNLIVMIGPPGCGKSTYIKKKILKNNNYIIISFDDIIMEMAKELNIDDYSLAYVRLFGAASTKLAEIAEKYLIERKDIIWDQTNISVKSRQKIFSILKKNKINDYHIKAISFEITEEEHKKRLEQRNLECPTKQIPQHIIENMKLSYDKPSLSEGFHELLFSRR